MPTIKRTPAGRPIIVGQLARPRLRRRRWIAWYGERITTARASAAARGWAYCREEVAHV